MPTAPSLRTIRKQYYQKNPHFWMRDCLGIPIETIDWGQHPAYLKPVKWDGIGHYHTSPKIDKSGNPIPENWDGTPNPLLAALHGLVDWKDVGIESATGTGKTFLAAAIVLWFLDVWGDDDSDEGCMVMTLSPKEDQLRKNLWKEIRRLWPAFEKLHPEAVIMDLEIRMRPDRRDWIAFGYPVGVGANEDVATRARGFHAPHMLIVFEEAPGIPVPVWEAIENTCTAPHNIRFGIGNPEHVTDALHVFCELPTTVAIRISALDHPNNVADDYTIINGAVSRTSVEKRLAKYKKDTHPLYQSSVRGLSPDVSDKSLFDADALALAKKYVRDPIRVVEHTAPCNGDTRIYFPVEHTHLNRYLMFGDVAGDDGRGDYHACFVFDRLKRRPAAIIHMRGPREKYIGEMLRLADLYRVWWPEQNKFFYPLLAWEKTGGQGSLILDERIKTYPNLYHGRSLEVPDPNLRASVGWDTTSRTRRSMVEELREWGLDLYTHPYRAVDVDFVKECSTFVWVQNGVSGRYEAASSCYDDRVLAFGGALVIDKLIPSPQLIIVESDEDRAQRELLERMASLMAAVPKGSWSAPLPNNW